MLYTSAVLYLERAEPHVKKKKLLILILNPRFFVQVVQVLRAVDKDQGGQDAPVHFSILPESGTALNLTIRESGGGTSRLPQNT